MPDLTPLSDAALAAKLEGLDGWSLRDNRLSKGFVFGSFPEAISFIVRIGFEAEALNHHPELSNVYNRVGVSLTTHDAGNRVTALDTSLASRIESISWV